MEPVYDVALAPKGLEAVVEVIHPDEKAYALVEVPIITNNSQRVHRFQVIYVNRGDRLAAHVIDLGPELVKLPASRIPSFWEHTVAELQDLAVQMRNDMELESILQEEREKSTLIKDVLELSQIRQRIISNQTLFGSGSTAATTQRTGFRRG